MQMRSILKPEGSVMAGIAVAGSVWGIYQMDIGPVSQAHLTPANHPSLDSSRRKAGYTAFLFVSAMTLITRDGNVGVLGYASIVAMEMHYRSAIMAQPNTGQMIVPDPAAYQPAGVPLRAVEDSPDQYTNTAGA